MVTRTRRKQRLASLREGLESLTVTGPSPILESVYQDALKAVENLPSQEEREEALNRAWSASSAEEMYRHLRQALSGTRPR